MIDQAIPAFLLGDPICASCEAVLGTATLRAPVALIAIELVLSIDTVTLAFVWLARILKAPR